MSATEYKAIYREINQYGYALVSVSVIETYPEETRSLMDSWVENNIDILTEGVLSEKPFDMVDNPLAEYAARLNKALTDAGLSGEAALFADGVVTAVDNISALKLLRASTEVDAKRIALYNIDLNNMNATQGIPLIWPTPLGTAPNSIIGIIDTGVEKTHSLLAGKVISEACFSSSFPLYIDSLCPSGVKALVGNNAGLPCADVATCYHGTYMAGIAAASQKEGAGVNYSGVAKAAKRFWMYRIVIQKLIFTPWEIKSMHLPLAIITATI
jgi:subtilisin family serine protease